MEKKNYALVSYDREAVTTWSYNEKVIAVGSDMAVQAAFRLLSLGAAYPTVFRYARLD